MSQQNRLCWSRRKQFAYGKTLWLYCMMQFKLAYNTTRSIHITPWASLCIRSASVWIFPTIWLITMATFKEIVFTIAILHDFSYINIRQVPWEVLKTEAEDRSFQHLPRDLVNVNALKNHVWLLLLHKNWKHLLHFALFFALFCYAFSPMSRERNFHRLCTF